MIFAFVPFIVSRCLVSTVEEPLLWDTSILGTPPSRGQKIWPRKNVHIIFVSIISVGWTPLFRGKGHFLWVPKPGFNLHSGDTLTLKK